MKAPQNELISLIASFNFHGHLFRDVAFVFKIDITKVC